QFFRRRRRRFVRRRRWWWRRRRTLRAWMDFVPRGRAWERPSMPIDRSHAASAPISLPRARQPSAAALCDDAGCIVDEGVAVSYVVISSFENVDTGDLQAEGEAVAVFAAEVDAQAHFGRRAATLADAVRDARTGEEAASFVTWLVLLRMPLDVEDVEQALEDLELVIEETESIDDPFGELVVRYEGHRHTPAGSSELP